MRTQDIRKEEGKESIPVLFKPNSEQSWPSGLEISEELLTILHGSSCRLQVNMSNTSILRPLYLEVKQHIKGLLNRGWMATSKSPYSSPVVCIRKKNGELRLCVDYCEMNKRTVPERHS